MNVIAGLQTKGIFCCHCVVKPDRIEVGWFWFRDSELLGIEACLVNSLPEQGDRYQVQLPTEISENPAQNVTLLRVLPIRDTDS